MNSDTSRDTAAPASPADAGTYLTPGACEAPGLSSRRWSPQQDAVFSWFSSGSGNLVVRARAGTGKTTTVIEGISRAPEPSILLAAFNKRIAEELGARLTSGRGEARTLHALGYGIVRRYWEHVRLDDSRDRDLARAVCGDGTPDAILTLVAKVAVRAKETIPDADAASAERYQLLVEACDAIPDREWEDDGYDARWIARQALAQVRASLRKDGRLSFADMLFLPVAHGWVKPRYDLVVIDEAQDMSATQLVLAHKLSRGRVCVVGDDRQGIYGFRGADSGSIDRMKRDLCAVELGLTVTYRCPRSVVLRAQSLVPDLTAADAAPEGLVTTLPEAGLPAAVEPGSFVLSRKNAPLVSSALSLLRAGKRTRIEGRDIGKGILALVRKINGKGRLSMRDFLARLDAWLTRETLRAQSLRNPEARIQLVTDQAETLFALAEGLSGVTELEARIEALFADGGGPDQIVCSTVHKAKGLEADTVYVLMDTFYPRGNRGDREEQNLEYVAITRAKRHLVIVSAGVKARAGRPNDTSTASPADPGQEGTSDADAQVIAS